MNPFYEGGKAMSVEITKAGHPLTKFRRSELHFSREIHCSLVPGLRFIG
jgi:hypothetical protein